MKPLPLILAIGFAILYGIFANQNEGIDAWFYAASIKHQDQIWQAHHLLFNAVQWCFWKCLCFVKLPIAPLRSIQLLNSIGAGLALYTVYAILLQLVFQRCDLPALLKLIFYPFALVCWQPITMVNSRTDHYFICW
jgi:hypothetical protein